MISAAAPEGDADAGRAVQFLVDITLTRIVYESGRTLVLNDGGVATFERGLLRPARRSRSTTPRPPANKNSKPRNYRRRYRMRRPSQGRAGLSISWCCRIFPTNLSINSPLTVKSVVSLQTGEVAPHWASTGALKMSGAVIVNVAGGAPTLLLNDGMRLRPITRRLRTCRPASLCSTIPSPAATTRRTWRSRRSICRPERRSRVPPATTPISPPRSMRRAGLLVGPAPDAAITPSLISDLTNGQTLQVTLTMSQTVTVNTGGGSPTLSLYEQRRHCDLQHRRPRIPPKGPWCSPTRFARQRLQKRSAGKSAITPMGPIDHRHA